MLVAGAAACEGDDPASASDAGGSDSSVRDGGSRDGGGPPGYDDASLSDDDSGAPGSDAGPLVCASGPVTAACLCGSELVSSGYCCEGAPRGISCSVVPAYYVSPTGSDSNDGTSLTTPFATLERARQAARSDSARKTIYLMDGVFERGSTLVLGNQDRGQSWLAYPGHTPILEGNSATEVAILIDTGNVTVRWITFRNFVTNTIGMYWGDGDDIVIDSNTILNTLSHGWVQAAIYTCCGKHRNQRITHNRIDGANYIGIHVGAAATNEGDISGARISHNEVYRTCRTVADCGGIYVWDVDYLSSDILIDNNVVGDFGARGTDGRGIYLDDNTSHVIARNNIVYGPGDWLLHYHGGSHNLFTNNIFDFSEVFRRMAVYSDTTGMSAEAMSGNAFRCNIVYSEAARPEALWNLYETVPIHRPEVSDNVYWGTRGALPNAAPVVDTNPTVADPGFADTAARDYSFRGASPGAGCGFTPIDVSTVGPLPNL